MNNKKSCKRIVSVIMLFILAFFFCFAIFIHSSNVVWEQGDEMDQTMSVEKQIQIGTTSLGLNSLNQSNIQVTTNHQLAKVYQLGVMHHADYNIHFILEIACILYTCLFLCSLAASFYRDSLSVSFFNQGTTLTSLKVRIND